MNKQIIARIKRKDGFIKEMVIPEYKPMMSFADVPPIRSCMDITEVNEGISKVIQRDFVPKMETVIIDYEEV